METRYRPCKATLQGHSCSAALLGVFAIPRTSRRPHVHRKNRTNVCVCVCVPASENLRANDARHSTGSESGQSMMSNILCQLPIAARLDCRYVSAFRKLAPLGSLDPLCDTVACQASRFQVCLCLDLVDE